MARLRYNFLVNSLGAELEAEVTAITFTSKLAAADGDVPTLAGDDYIVLAIGNEIVHLTEYTEGETTGTIERGIENSGDVFHPSGAVVINSPTAADFGAGDGIPQGGPLTDDLDGDQYAIENLSEVETTSGAYAGTLKIYYEPDTPNTDGTFVIELGAPLNVSTEPIAYDATVNDVTNALSDAIESYVTASEAAYDVISDFEDITFTSDVLAGLDSASVDISSLVGGPGLYSFVDRGDLESSATMGSSGASATVEVLGQKADLTVEGAKTTVGIGGNNTDSAEVAIAGNTAFLGVAGEDVTLQMVGVEVVLQMQGGESAIAVAMGQTAGIGAMTSGEGQVMMGYDTVDSIGANGGLFMLTEDGDGTYNGIPMVSQSLTEDAPFIRSVATITQDDYDDLDPPDPRTLYVIVEVE